MTKCKELSSSSPCQHRSSTCQSFCVLASRMENKSATGKFMLAALGENQLGVEEAPSMSSKGRLRLLASGRKAATGNRAERECTARSTCRTWYLFRSSKMRLRKAAAIDHSGLRNLFPLTMPREFFCAPMISSHCWVTMIPDHCSPTTCFRSACAMYPTTGSSHAVMYCCTLTVWHK